MVDRLVDISVTALCVVARMENCSFRASLILSICFSRCFRFSLHTFFWCLICFALFLCSAGGYSFSILEFNFLQLSATYPQLANQMKTERKRAGSTRWYRWSTHPSREAFRGSYMGDLLFPRAIFRTGCELKEPAPSWDALCVGFNFVVSSSSFWQFSGAFVDNRNVLCVFEYV